MLESDLNNPQIYSKNKDYLLIKDATFENIDFMDCNDTVDGICYTKKSFDECVNICTDSKNCAIGHYIKTPKHNYCIPLKTDIFPDLNYAHRLKNKNIYPELKNSTTTVFINNSKFSYPPNEANTIFTYDKMTFKCNDLFMGGGSINNDKPDTMFRNSVSAIHIQPIPYGIVDSHIIRYLPIRYNSMVYFRIVDTSFILTKNDETNIFEWQFKLLNNEETYDTFKIIPLHNEKYIFDIDKTKVNYKTKFNLIYNNFENCYIDNLGNFKTSSDSFDKLEVNGNKVIFEFIPKDIAYYCDNGKCKSIMLEKTDANNENAIYNGKEVFRTKQCYNLCKKNKKSVLIIFILLIIVILWISYAIYLYINLIHHPSSFYAY